jgi:hypothetical protein
VKYESFLKPRILEVENHGCYWKGFEYKTGLEFKKEDLKALSKLKSLQTSIFGF